VRREDVIIAVTENGRDWLAGTALRPVAGRGRGRAGVLTTANGRM